MKFHHFLKVFVIAIFNLHLSPFPFVESSPVFSVGVEKNGNERFFGNPEVSATGNGNGHKIMKRKSRKGQYDEETAAGFGRGFNKFAKPKPVGGAQERGGVSTFSGGAGLRTNSLKMSWKPNSENRNASRAIPAPRAG